MKVDKNSSNIFVSAAEAAVNLFVAIILVSLLLYFWLVLIFGVESIEALKNFATASKEIMISLLIIVGCALIPVFFAMFIGWLCKDEGGIIILPFEVAAGEEKYNGKALSHLLTTELLRIQRIHETKYKGITPIESENVYCPTIKPSSENISTEIAKIGTLEAGTASIPLGQILVSIKKVWPWGTNSRVISGCLQKYGSTISLMGCLEDRNMETWEAKNIDKGKKIGDEIIPDLARDLAFMIVHYLSSEETEDKDDKKITAKTWRSFKYFFGSLEAYNLYTLSGDMKYLDLARTECLEAANSEMGYKRLLKLLYNIAMEYSNKNELYEAEKLLFLAYKINPDDYYTLVGLGHIYMTYRQYSKALDYFVRATMIKPESCVGLYNKGRALLALGRDKEALEADEKATYLCPDDALAWGSKGGALTKLGRYDEAIEACKKAIELDKSLAIAYSNMCIALDKLKKTDEALSYRKEAAKLGLKSAGVYIPLACHYRKQKNEAERVKACEYARNLIDTDYFYNHACFEAVCGSPDAALDLLKIALKNKEQTADWARQDPDFEFIRDDPRFEALLDEFSESEEKGPE